MPTRSGTPHRDGGVGHFQHQPGAVLDAAAVAIGALVAAVLEELVQQVTVGAVDFYAVEACPLGVLCALAIALVDGRNLGCLEGPRCYDCALRRSRLTLPLAAMALGARGSSPPRCSGSENAAHVPELAEDAATGSVDRLRRLLPTLYLRARPDPWSVGIAHTRGADRRGFRQDQPGASALGVVLRHQICGHAPPHRRGSVSMAPSRRGWEAAGRRPGWDRTGCSVECVMAFGILLHTSRR